MSSLASATECASGTASRERCTAARFRELVEQADWKTLRELDTSCLASRVIADDQTNLHARLSSPSEYSLNTKQVVFVTPTSSWIDWGEQLDSTTVSSEGSSKAAKALDFVGWNTDDIEWARSSNKSAMIYVWEDPELAERDCTATWDFVFDFVLPECAAGAASFKTTKGKEPRWAVIKEPLLVTSPSVDNEFVRIAQTLRGKVSTVPLNEADIKEAKDVGSLEVVQAAESDRPLKVRQALKSMFYLETAFAGDGFTRNRAGVRCAPELIVSTRRFSELEQLEGIDLGKV